MSQSEIVFQVEGFDLRQTLESGQCFRWHCLGERDYWGVVQGCALRAKQTDADLHVRVLAGVPPQELQPFVSRYFDLERDYTPLLKRLREDPVMASLLPPRPTIRILGQDPFEVIVSFVISANNHIPRIRAIIERLCRCYGSVLETPFGRAYTFPSLEALARARVSDLRHRCGLGYRDVYVRSVAQAIAAADFTSWERLPTDVLRARLRELDGVGEKVAECILLFGYHRLEAFPVDTWIFRAMTELYFSGGRPRPADIRALALRRFGDAAGVAQQYLYAIFRDRYRGDGRLMVPDVSSAGEKLSLCKTPARPPIPVVKQAARKKGGMSVSATESPV